MKTNVYEIFDESDLDKALKIVLSNFKTSEKNEYSKQGLASALTNLSQFDVFAPKSLFELVKNGVVSVFITSDKSGTVAMEKSTGRLLFLSAKSEKEYILLLEKIMEIRADDPEGKLVLLAFLGQLNELKKIGFYKIYDTVFVKSGVKFVPLQFNYIQIDSEI